MHLNVSDPAAWYAEWHPGEKLGDLVPEPCPFCFGEIFPRDRVITRRLVTDNVTIDPEQRGEIVAVLSNKEFGKLYIVALDSGKSLTCPRSAIRKRRDGER